MKKYCHCMMRGRRWNGMDDETLGWDISNVNALFTVCLLLSRMYSLAWS